MFFAVIAGDGKHRYNDWVMVGVSYMFRRFAIAVLLYDICIVTSTSYPFTCHKHIGLHLYDTLLSSPYSRQSVNLQLIV